MQAVLRTGLGRRCRPRFGGGTPHASPCPNASCIPKRPPGSQATKSCQAKRGARNDDASARLCMDGEATCPAQLPSKPADAKRGRAKPADAGKAAACCSLLLLCSAAPAAHLPVGHKGGAQQRDAGTAGEGDGRYNGGLQRARQVVHVCGGRQQGGTCCKRKWAAGPVPGCTPCLHATSCGDTGGTPPATTCSACWHHCQRTYAQLVAGVGPDHVVVGQRLGHLARQAVRQAALHVDLVAGRGGTCSEAVWAGGRALQTGGDAWC